MAAQIFQTNHEISRQEIQAAIAKAVELRALHSALLQGNSPSNLRLPTCASPSIHSFSNQFSAEDYPVFTPSYEEEPIPGYHHMQPENRRLSEIWDGIGLELGEKDEADLSENRKTSLSSRKVLSSSLVRREQHIGAEENHKSNTGACINHITVLQTSPGTEIFKSGWRTGSGEFKTVTTCNACKPATISRENDIDNKNSKSYNSVMPLTDSHSSLHSQSKSKGSSFSWLFPRLKKKNKAETSPSRVESEDMFQISKDWGLLTLESLKKELLEANENRDAALMEVAEMRSSLGELTQKLVRLETYCDELKKAMKHTVQGKDNQVPEIPNLTKRGKSIDGLPVSHEVMVEGFLQIVSEARLSVKQFCKTLIGHIEETDDNLMEKLNLSLHSKYSKGVLYHLESLINHSLHQDFENCVFQKNGSPKVLDPQQDRQGKFSAFVALRNLSWNEVLRKGTKYYSEEFSKFCDQKMSCIISVLNWSRPWPEQLLQSFFVAAKCIWLLHLLAFSFSPPLAILRVEENRSFDPLYMEDILLERQRSQSPAKVKIMVMPGFYVEDKMLRCKVLCRYKTIA
ncbi:DNA double-strand break repair RAD50 ATPase [Tasmannia lanceolata]|uniref:DNA double-strand break repair RAD50 ATPase n=1 Tax=Tasmannia lanceolata TaxID=3420 RepID=UPI004063010A